MKTDLSFDPLAAETNAIQSPASEPEPFRPEATWDAASSDAQPNTAATVQLRRAQRADFPRVLELLRYLWPEKRITPHLAQGVYERALQADYKRYYCAETAAGVVIGLGSVTFSECLWQEGPMGFIEEIVVDPAHRNQGVARLLLTRLLQDALEQGCRRIELDTAFHRLPAHALYESIGFEKRGFIFSKKLLDPR